nr:YetF domain-containing protein [Pseudochelatococcus contaminans]
MNISGKTQLSQMTPIDFIGNFVLGGIIGGVIYSDSVPLYQYISVLLIGVVLISLLNFISKNLAAFRIFTIGEPIPIIKNGKFLMDNILQRKGKIDILNVASQMHLQGIHSFQEIYYAQIEPNGQLTAVCGRSRIPSVIVVKNGNIIANELSAVDLTEDDVQKALADLNIKPEDVFIGEFWDGGLSFVLNSGEVVKQQPAD